MRISDWSSDVCASDLQDAKVQRLQWSGKIGTIGIRIDHGASGWEVEGISDADLVVSQSLRPGDAIVEIDGTAVADLAEREVLTLLHGEIGSPVVRSEEHTSELQSLMRISYAFFCLKKTNNI